MTKLETVKVPAEFVPIFQRANDFVSEYFAKKNEDPTKGTIEIFGERYLLVRAASMSVDFFDTVKGLYQDQGEEEAVNVATSLLFDVAHSIGKTDAKMFHKSMDLHDPIEKLSAGPIHFSHTGWAFVDIFPESRPVPDESFFLVYDHPFSFESDAWIKAGKDADFPVCVMNAGYSSGWCEESFGLPLVAAEVTCRARGDEACRFVMAHPSKIEQYIAEYAHSEPSLAKKITSYQVPQFFRRKELEHEWRKHKTLSDRANHGVAVVDLEGNLDYINDYFAQVHGYTAEELQGRNLRLFHTEEQMPRVDALNRQVSEAGSYNAEEVWHKHRDGQVFPMLMNGVLIRDAQGEPLHIAATATDISDLKQAEKKLEQTADQLRSSNEDLQQFAYVASHDLKEPLRMVASFLQLLQKKYGGKLDTEGDEYIAFAVDGAQRMKQLIDDLLAYSRVSTQDEETVAVDCEALLRRALANLRLAIRDSEATVTHDPLPRLEVDPTQFTQLFQNLVGNAIKFCGDAAPVIHVGASCEENGWQFSVADQGIGFDPRHLRRIFDIFQRLHKRETYPGTGIGLAVSKKIVQRHGGTIWAESTPGEGSTFYFTVPDR